MTLRKESLANFFEKICLVLFPKLQQNTQTHFASFQKNRVDFGLDSFLKCTEIQPNTDLFDFLEGCSCSLETTALRSKETQIFLSGFHFPVFKKKNNAWRILIKKIKKKRETVKKFEVQRKFLKALIKNQSLPQGLRYEYMLKLHKSCKKKQVQSKL